MASNPENPMPEDSSHNREREGDAESERSRKIWRGLTAVALGALWIEYKGLSRLDPTGGLPGGELSTEDKEKIEKQGWLRTAAEKAASYYKAIGKAEDRFDKIKQGNWDGVFSEKPPGENPP